MSERLKRLTFLLAILVLNGLFVAVNAQQVEARRTVRWCSLQSPGGPCYCGHGINSECTSSEQCGYYPGSPCGTGGFY